MKKIIRLLLFFAINLNFIFSNNISNYLEEIIKNKTSSMQINIWIYFVDKGKINIEQEIQKLMVEANQDQIKRRLKVKNNIFDFRDIPLYQPYINNLLKNSKITLRTQSKWLNAISISLPIYLINEISQNNFVKKIDLVKSGKRKDNLIIKNKQNPSRNNYGPSYNQLEQIK